MSDLIKSVPNDIVPAFIGRGPSGFEGIDNDCVSIPFLRLAQVNTPQAQPGPDRLAGLEAGMYFNPSTGRIYGKEPRFIMLGFYRSWNVWNGEPPNASFVRSMTNDEFVSIQASTHKDDKGKVVDSQGNRYQDTRNFFVLSADHPEDGILLYPMTSTGIPMSKKWLAKAWAIKVKSKDGTLVSAPMWSRVWQFKVNFVTSPKGNYFQVADATDQGWIDQQTAPIAEAAFDEAMAYDKSRVQGAEKTTPAQADDTPEWMN